MSGVIKTCWFWRKGEDGPELLQAWDYYSWEQWQEGWDEACRKAFEEVSSDDAGHGPRFIDVRIPWEPVEQAFWPTEVEAESVEALARPGSEPPQTDSGGEG